MARLKIRTKKLLVGLAVGTSVGTLVGLAAAARTEATENLELATYDLRAAYGVAPERASKDILIIDVDEQSVDTAAKFRMSSPP